MNTKIFIAVIFASIIFANGLRVLGAAERAPHKYELNLFLNGSEVIVGGTLDLQEAYLCVKPGEVANSVTLNKISVMEGKYCFPYVDFKYIDNNFSKMKKVLLFNIYSVENLTLSENIRVELVFTGKVEVEALEQMFEVINQDMTEIKIQAKKLSDLIFVATDEYNSYVVRFATGLKSRPEIEREIEENQVSIDRNENEINQAKIRFNDHQADCTTSDAEREDALASLRNRRDKLVNLHNTIFNNRKSIKSYEHGIYEKEIAVADCRKVRDAAKETCDGTLVILKGKLPDQTDDLNEVSTEINKPLKGSDANSRIQVVTKLIDGFVNVSA
jgi:hypothetical protein